MRVYCATARAILASTIAIKHPATGTYTRLQPLGYRDAIKRESWFGRGGAQGDNAVQAVNKVTTTYDGLYMPRPVEIGRCYESEPVEHAISWSASGALIIAPCEHCGAKGTEGEPLKPRANLGYSAPPESTRMGIRKEIRAYVKALPDSQRPTWLERAPHRVKRSAPAKAPAAPVASDTTPERLEATEDAIVALEARCARAEGILARLMAARPEIMRAVGREIGETL